MLQKVNWVCEEDELSMGPVEFYGPAGHSGWVGAELGEEDWTGALWTISTKIGAGTERR